MEESEKVELTGSIVPWFEGARELLAKAERDGDAALDSIEREIRANQLTLFKVCDTWETLGYFTAKWVPQHNGEKHLAIIHGIALKEESGFSFMATINHLVRKIARECGCQKVQIHTDRRGADRIVEKCGWTYQESIYTVVA